MSPLLNIKGLHISVEDTEVVKGIDLKIQPGEIHTIMGPNGSGKSSLVNALMGHPAYEITQGSAKFNGNNLLEMEPHERAQAGLFLAFQYPKEIAGVTLRSFLFAAYNACHPNEKKISPIKFKKFLEEHMKELHMDPTFAERFVNQGFSGGEKKKAEVLQMKILQPQLALLDETDSGLDVDALQIVSEGVNALRKTVDGNRYSDFSALIVTHYARILQYIQPDYVHVMVQGKIVKSGDFALAKELEDSGYKHYL